MGLFPFFLLLGFGYGSKEKKEENGAHVLSFGTVDTSTIITSDKKVILSRIRTYIKA